LSETITLAVCKIPDCTEPAKSKFGVYGGLCEAHAIAAAAAKRRAHNGATPAIAGDYESLVLEILLAIDDIFAAAQPRLGQILRDEIAARITPRQSEQ